MTHKCSGWCWAHWVGGMLVVVLIAGIASCAGTPIGGTAVFGHQVRRVHDDSLRVTCWTVLDEGAISCIPDSQLGR